MRVWQSQWNPGRGWSESLSGAAHAQLVLALGDGSALREAGLREQLRELFPSARIAFASTAGEVFAGGVHDDSLVVTAIHFANTPISAASQLVSDPGESFEAGQRLASELMAPGREALAHVMVVSCGLTVNGSALVRGLTEGLPPNTSITGGLAADGARFEETLVGLDDDLHPGLVVAIGLHGSRLSVGIGSGGGWDTFGASRLITRSEGNALFELDGEPALKLYKTYLGAYASELPASALLFPLSITLPGGAAPLTRTILSVDEALGSMTFAGDVPEGATARLMTGNIDRLVDGATEAAKEAKVGLGESCAELALLVSCVGRKLVLKSRLDEEVEAVGESLGPGAVLAGFYSYGEICPQAGGPVSELHNQTMTITTLAERGGHS